MARRRKGLHFGREKKKVNVSLIKEILIWIAEIIMVLAIAYVCVYFVGMRTTVLGQSMLPTLDAKEEVLVDRFIYKVSKPKVNDIVVFLPNGNEKSHYYIKRVIAVPGDKVVIKDGIVYVNDEVFDEKVDVDIITEPGVAGEEFTLGEDEYFVLGDNRNNSEDSRYANIGNVKKQYIIGKAWFIFSPMDRFGFLKDSGLEEVTSEPQ